MPSGKRQRASNPEPETVQAEPVDDGVAVEEAADVVEPTTSSAEETPVEAPPAEKKGRRNFLRRNKKQSAPIPAETPAESVEAQEPAQETIAEPAASLGDEGEAAEQTEPENPTENIVFVPHQPAGRRLKIAAAAAAVLFVAGGAFLGATAQPVIANSALIETKLNIARTAANAITTLWSYTPEDMDKLGERSARYLTGDFAFQYKKFIDSIVATNKQAQVTNTTSVLGTAVESVTPTDASAVGVTDCTAVPRTEVVLVTFACLLVATMESMNFLSWKAKSPVR